MPRSTPRSKRSESRRSSILKPRKPRQPLQSVNFDSPHNEKSSSPSKVKRRVSFADKKHVKEFCHSVEQGTVWDSTYEERDSSLKGSFDSNAKTESKEDASSCVTTHEYVHIFESNSSCQVNSFVLTNDKLSESVITVKGKDEENCNLDFTNPVQQMELSNEESQFEQTILSNRSALSQLSKDAILSNIACSNTDEKYVESFDERPPVEQIVVPNALPIAHPLKNAISSIVIYRDSDEEENVNNPGIKSYTECNNIELDKTHEQDLSMEFTASVPTPLLVSCTQEKINSQKDNYTLCLNLDTNYVSNNVSTLAVPEVCRKSVNSDLGIFDQISEMQNHGSTNWNAGPNNIHDKMIFSTNLQSNVASENSIFKQTQDATQNINESMMLTNVIQPFTANTDVSRTNNTAFSASMEMTTAVSSKMYEYKSISQNIIKESDLRENQTNKTEFFNDVMMEMTKPVNVLSSTLHDKENLRMDELISKEDRTVFFHNVSMEITKPLKNREENTRPIPIYKSVFEESACKEKNMDISTGSSEKTKLLCKSMEFTEAVPVFLHHETPDILCTAQSIAFPQTMSTACSPVFKNSTDSILQIDTASSKIIQDTSMEITTAVPSTLYLTRDATSEKENLNVSKDNEFHHLTTSNLIESRKSAESTLQAGTAAIKTIQDTSMEITTAVPSTLHLTRDATSEKENLNISKDNEFHHLTTSNLIESRKSAESTLQAGTAAIKTIQDTSMEITTAVPLTLHLTRDATSEKENLNVSKDNEFHHLTTSNLIESRKSAESTLQAGTAAIKTIQDTSMEITTAVPSTLHLTRDATSKKKNLNVSKDNAFHHLTSNLIESRKSAESTLQAGTAAIKTIQDTSMEITTAVPSTLHLTRYATSEKENLNVSKDNEFHHLTTNNLIESRKSAESILQAGTAPSKMIQNTSMEITTAVPSTLHLTRDATSEEENLNVSKDNEVYHLTKNNLTESRKTAESTLQVIDTAASKMIQDTSMEIATVPLTLHLTRDATSEKEKNLNIFKDNEFQYLTKNDLREESKKIAESILVDTAASKMIQDASMEVTTAVPSTLHLTRDATNEKKNFNISKVNEFHHLTTSNLIELRKNAIKENYTILRKIATDTHNESPKNSIISSNLHHSLDVVLKSVNSRRETFDENEQSSPKICKLLMNSHTSQENNVCLSSSANGIYTNDTGHNEYFVKDTTMDHTELSKSNFGDNPNESGECSLLRKTLGDSIEELHSIKPPSFILDNDEEENSFSDVSCEDKLQTSTNNGTINNIHNSSNQLVTNNVGEYECLAESRGSVAKDNKNFTILRENKHDREDQVNCQVIKRTTIDNQVNESNHCAVNIENSHVKIALLTQNSKHEEGNIDHCKTKPIIKESEITADKEHIRKSINDDANSQNDIKGQCIDRPKKTEIIKNYSSSEKSCKENLNDEVTGMKRNEKCTEERFAAEQCVSTIIDESLAEQDPFLSLSHKLEIHGERDDCIWNVYHKNIDRKMIVFGFMSNSLLIAMFLSYDINCSERNLIDKIKIISRISDDSGVLIRIVHKLILEKLDAESLMHRYRIHEDILPMLECVSQHVKLAMDFIFDLKQLDDLNLMEITYDEISFLSRSKQMDIILEVTIKVKRFDELTSKDVNVNCLLGTIRENDVKSLIKNIKKDHKFLRKFMNDVKDYIDIMEETLIFKKV